MKLLPYIAQEYSRPSQCGQNIQPCGLVHQMLHSAPMVTHTPAPGSFKVATDSAWEFSDWQKKKKKNVGAKKKKSPISTKSGGNHNPAHTLDSLPWEDYDIHCSHQHTTGSLLFRVIHINLLLPFARLKAKL